MTRKIKRLFERWDPADIDDLIQRGDFNTWRDEFAWWKRVGVDAKTLIGILENARSERLRYEEQLQGRETRQHPRNIREAQKALKEAGPLIRFLKTKKALGDDGSPELVFGDLGERVERAIQNYINEPPRAVRLGRPGDSWLVRCVMLFASMLMFRPYSERRARPRPWVRQSEKSTIRAIERVLKLAGHGEVVTKEKIRHVIRQVRPILRKHRAGDGSIMAVSERLTNRKAKRGVRTGDQRSN